MIITKVDNENPNEHWQYVNVSDRVVLDLGCGRWEHVERRDPNWPTTPEYFKQNGAKKVVAVDCDINEINWYNSVFSEESSYYDFILSHIHSSNDFSSLILKYQPNCVKVDIEGMECHLVDVPDDIFRSVEEYYIETHSQYLFNSCMSKLVLCGYIIYNQIDLVHTNGACMVIFAKKQ
jgi:hypothetical protein